MGCSDADHPPRRSGDSEHLPISVKPRRGGQARPVGRHNCDWLASICQFSNRIAVAVQNRFASNAVEIGLERQMRAPRRLGDLRRQFDLLRKP